MEHREALLALRTFLSTQILGQEKLIDRLLIALLADGHMLVEGAPGLAKTKAIKELAEGIEAEFHRIQFTPDLLPADITGTEIYRPETGSFVFQQGPIFHNLVLADEINRAPAKVQSALLEAMAERQVSVGRSTYELSPLFLVMATQNPIEQEGTYPLPEAQLDRFTMQIDVPYPTREAERAILIATTGTAEDSAVPVLDAHELTNLQALVRAMPVGEQTLNAILDLLARARPDGSTDREIADAVAWGPGPRAGQALMLAVRARALVQGRLAPSTEDVAALAGPVLKHRMALTFAARADGLNVDRLIARLAAEAA